MELEVGEVGLHHVVAFVGQGLGDSGGGRVELDPEDPMARWRLDQERAAAAARFEHDAGVDAKRGDRSPQGSDDADVGVVSVERGARRGGESDGSQQGFQALTVGGEVWLVEELWCCAPAVPPLENRSFVRRRAAPFVCKTVEEFEGGEVVVDCPPSGQPSSALSVSARSRSAIWRCLICRSISAIRTRRR
jgi:hypothetical protein